VYNHIIQMLEPHADKVSYLSRMRQTQAFFEEAGIIDIINKPHVEEPLSIVWALSTQAGEVFDAQLRCLLQQSSILQDHDQIVLVAEKERRQEVTSVVSNLAEFVDIKVIYIDRHCVGDRPTLNWDIGLNYAKYNRVLFLRDLCLFFNPWNLIKEAREVSITNRITNMSVILGPTLSRYTDQWAYLVHPFYSPTPFLFAFVASRDDVKRIGGFDPVFARGFDHAGELDFMIRWAMKNNTYDINGDITVLHPGIPTTRASLEEMQFHSTVNRRYFYDRYGEEFINKLKPPLKLDLPLIEVNHALTLSPFMVKPLDDQFVDLQPKAFDFMKRPLDYYVVEETQ